jgi:PAS domain S-box-containing protein
MIERRFETKPGEHNPAILDDLPTIAYTADPAGTITFVSKQFCRQTGTASGESLASAWPKSIHPDDRERAAERWAAAVAASAPYEDELRFKMADGTYRWYLSRALPVRNAAGELTGYAGTAFDIDAQKTAESNLRDLIALYERVSARESLYAQLGEELASALSLDETADVVLRAFVPAFADWVSVYVRNREDTQFEIVAMRHWDEGRRPLVESLIGTTFTTDQSATAEVLRTGKSILLETYPEELRTRSIRATYQAQLHELGLRSAIVVPFKHREKVIGAIHVIRGDNPVNFGPSDLQLIEELARRMTPAVHNAEIYERERLVAQRFQEAALPTALPEIAGITFDAVYVAAENETQIGGDWYDAFRLDDGRVVLSIGDVAGHGLDAAVTMSSVRQSLRAAAVIDPDPVAMLRVGDSIVRGLGPELFVTAFVAVVDAVSLELSFAGAGHPPPLLRHADGKIELLKGAGLPLGMYKGTGRTASSAQLGAGCLLALYTDGLTEFDRDPVDGERRVKAALIASDGVEPARAIYRAVAGGRPGRDDIAILTVAFGPVAGNASEATQWSFDAGDASTARTVRGEIAERLTAHELDSEKVTLAELVLSELMGNVVRHTIGRVQVLLEASADEVRLHVADEGPPFDASLDAPVDPWSERGRGLFIVNALVDERIARRRRQPRPNDPPSRARGSNAGVT